MDKALADLIRISNVTGKDPTLVQGGGGNTSVKTADGKYMYHQGQRHSPEGYEPKAGLAEASAGSGAVNYRR